MKVINFFLFLALTVTFVSAGYLNTGYTGSYGTSGGSSGGYGGGTSVVRIVTTGYGGGVGYGSGAGYGSVAGYGGGSGYGGGYGY